MSYHPIGGDDSLRVEGVLGCLPKPIWIHHLTSDATPLSPEELSEYEHVACLSTLDCALNMTKTHSETSTGGTARNRRTRAASFGVVVTKVLGSKKHVECATSLLELVRSVRLLQDCDVIFEFNVRSV